ncbi:MAG: ATP-binding protein [Rhodovibrionaceae bacterium]
MPSEKIQFLINNLQENLEVEVKNWLGGLATNEERSKLAKEIIALANSGGGYIFIGFSDEGEGHPEIEPEQGQLEAFTQDTVSDIVRRYVEPPCQCGLEFYTRDGSEIRHPVIIVPGEHRTPVWAKRSSPGQGGAGDERTLEITRVYVRRPGGASEPARTQDDWEKLLDRLVKARQSDQLDAIREILNPSDRIVPQTPALDEWDAESLALWKQRIEPLQEEDARRLRNGFWTFSFSITPFDRPALVELNEGLEREMPSISGWPPFTYIHREPLRPHPRGDVIEAWLAEPHDAETLVEQHDHHDYWRVSRSGMGFLLRPMQEDSPHYLANMRPRPEGPHFDWIIPIYRAVELLKFVESFAQKFSTENAEYNVILKYYGMAGRTLQQHNFRYLVRDGARCTEDEVESRLSGTVAEISFSLEERVHALMAPIYEQFEFTSLAKTLVDNVTRDALNDRRR